MIKPSQKIYLDISTNPKAGRGIFAVQDISAGEIIEICPVIELSRQDSLDLIKKRTDLSNYYFMWGEGREKTMIAICLGFGSLYNHSYEPNATYKKQIKDRAIHFVAIKDIKQGEEIFVNYNYGDPNDKSPTAIKGIDAYKPAA